MHVKCSNHCKSIVTWSKRIRVAEVHYVECCDVILFVIWDIALFSPTLLAWFLFKNLFMLASMVFLCTEIVCVVSNMYKKAHIHHVHVRVVHYVQKW